MKRIILILLFCFVVPVFSQQMKIPLELPTYKLTDKTNIIGVWSGSNIKYAEIYIRWSLQMRFEYLPQNSRVGIYYSILLARAIGGGLDSWEINGLFEKYAGKMELWPAVVKVGSIVLPDSMVNDYTINIVFTSDSTAYVPNTIFGRMMLKKQKSKDSYIYFRRN